MPDFLKQGWVWIIIVAILIAGAIIIFRGEIEVDQTVLKVNQTPVTQSEFNSYIDQVIQEYQMYGMEPGEMELKADAVRTAIQRIVLLEYANEKEIVPSKEEIEDRYQEYKDQHEMGMMPGEELLTLAQAEEDLIEIIKIEKLIELYGEEVEITDEDLERDYAEYLEQAEMMEMEEILTFEEIKGDLEEYLIQERAIDAILETLDRLTQEAEVEIFIDIPDHYLEDLNLVN